MMENYRSTPEILSAANSLIAQEHGPVSKRTCAPPCRPAAPVRLPLRADPGGRRPRGWRGRCRPLHDGGNALPGHDRALPGPLCHPDGGGGAAAGEDPLYHLQRRAVFRPHGDQGRPVLPAHDRLSGRPVLPAHRQRQPKRNMGKRRRMAFLQEYAAQAGLLAVSRPCSRQCWHGALFKRTRAPARFVVAHRVPLPSGLRGAVRSRRCCPPSCNESGYEAMLRTEGSQERLDNLAELKQSVYEYETTCGEEVHPGALSGPCGPVHQRRRGRQQGDQREADDRPRGQGTGIPPCVPVRA